MHIYGPSQLHGPQSIAAPPGARPAQSMTRPEAPQIADQVDISDAARSLEQRQDRVEAVRQQIAEGTYETPARLNAAIERLLDEIG